ncbi:MAG: Asp-tRNA(Asn)/Glu-tRNA(Gln) amidotransferase subunit GatA [Elusimicrobia bacterium]|nr:Asp-tRNA(Asn)/Glu-tRNA(Gln) amidotransferase subunit GatA [Elusimicrobiota bacterium]
MLDLSAVQTAGKVKAGQLRPLEILDAYYGRIEKLEPKIKAYLLLLKDRAYGRAREMEARLKSGRPLGRLAGVAVAVKDNMVLEDYPTTCGSKILEGYVSTYTATALERLENEDALILGKTNLDEFAMGSSTENSAFGPSRNPWDTSRVPGGSSGGSAAAVAARMACAALGSETGGSVRQPASFCGVVGLKPTYGRVSRYGLVAFGSSLDQIGPLARTAEDAALIFDVISGHDPKDSTSLVPSKIQHPSSSTQHLSGIKVGLPKEYFSVEGADPEVFRVTEEAVKVLAAGGAKIEEVSLPHSRFALPTYYIVAPSEASANLARFDGVRYGLRAGGQAGSLLGLYKASRTQGLGHEVQRRILIGTFALSHGYYDAYYGRAQQARALIARDFEEVFKNVDFVVSPTAPTAAFKLGEKTQDPVSMYLSDIFTIPVNLAGIAGASVCCGFSKDNLPLGLQIVGPAGRDEDVLGLAAHWERLTRGQYIQIPQGVKNG